MKVRAKAPSGVDVVFWFESPWKYLWPFGDATTIGSTIHLKGHSFTNPVQRHTVEWFGHEVCHVEQKYSLFKYFIGGAYRGRIEGEAQAAGALRAMLPEWQAFTCEVLSKRFGFTFRMAPRSLMDDAARLEGK